jgi:hypothetical protein
MCGRLKAFRFADSERHLGITFFSGELEAQGKLAGMRSTVELLYRPLQGNRPSCFGCLVGPNQQLTGCSN